MYGRDGRREKGLLTLHVLTRREVLCYGFLDVIFNLPNNTFAPIGNQAKRFLGLVSKQFKKQPKLSKILNRNILK